MGDRLNTGTFATTLLPQSLVQLSVRGNSCALFYYVHTDENKTGLSDQPGFQVDVFAAVGLQFVPSRSSASLLKVPVLRARNCILRKHPKPDRVIDVW